ncbi:MAG: cupin domain-containing protein [Syntrophobacter sp.]
MVRQARELRSEKIQEMRGGKGEVKVIHILEKEEFHNKGRLFAHNILKPGTSIGMHPHEGDFEAYYVIRGEGMFYEDGGVKNPVRQGDLGVIEVGKSHGLENTGTTDLEVIALILYE